MKIINKNYLSEQYLKDDKLLINHNYLKQQFKNSKKILSDIKKLIKNGDYTLGKAVNEVETKFKRIERKMEKLRITNEQLRESGIYWHDACKETVRDLLGKRKVR